jgi:integrase
LLFSQKAVRQRMIDLDWCRTLINQRISRIKRCFKWAVSEELIPPSVHHGLQTVVGLARGRSDARESEPVQPVADALVEAVIPYVLPPVAAMIQIQRLTGMRPGEVVQMRRIDIDNTESIWLYRPATHKTKYRGKDRVIHLGPKAQELLRPFMTDDSNEYLFNPARAMAERALVLRINRKTPVQPSQQQRKKSERRKQPGNHYTRDSYRRAIEYGIAKADAAARQQAIKRGMDPNEAVQSVFVAHWHPNQLRHTRATEVRMTHGLEAAQVLLGHSFADDTQVYAQRNFALAKKVAEEVG